ncbi:hypothetical protein AKO1_014120, partial [Acrasis kona]
KNPDEANVLNSAIGEESMQDDPYYAEKYQKVKQEVKQKRTSGASLLLKLDIIVGAILLTIFYFFLTRPAHMWTLKDFVRMLDPRSILKPN